MDEKLRKLVLLYKIKLAVSQIFNDSANMNNYIDCMDLLLDIEFQILEIDDSI